MLFIESINESYDIEYHESGELGDPILKIIDKDNKKEHRFYPEDIKVMSDFLRRLSEFGVLKVERKDNK